MRNDARAVEQIQRTWDGLRHKHRLTHCSNLEFDEEMQAIDLQLKEINAPFVTRPMQGLSMLAQKYHFGLEFSEPFTQRVSQWFEERYGSRLNLDLSYGKVPVLLFGDAYSMRVPVLFFGGWLVASNGPVEEKLDRPVVNVVEWVQNIPEGLIYRLGEPELKMLLEAAKVFTSLLSRIDKLRNEQDFKNAFGNLESSTHLLTTPNFQVGLSRWESLQATEKFFKAYISLRGEQYKYVHDLGQLNEHAKRLGLNGVDLQWITKVQCDASMRYAPHEGSVEDAVSASHACLEICAVIADAVVELRGLV